MKDKVTKRGKWVRFTKAILRKGWESRHINSRCPLARGFKAAGFDLVQVFITSVTLNCQDYRLEGKARDFYNLKILGLDRPTDLRRKMKVCDSFELFVQRYAPISQIRPLQVIRRNRKAA